MSRRSETVFTTIANRLKSLDPPVNIAKYIAMRNGASSLKAYEYLLDGFDFKTDDPDGLMDDLALARNPVTGKPAFTSMIEEPRHWALKASLAATNGTGYREVIRPKVSGERRVGAPRPDSMMSMRFGNAGVRIEYSALHCAVSTGTCNVHIDTSGFIIEAEDGGSSLAPDSYDHLISELVINTKIRDWLLSKTDNQAVKDVIRDIMGRFHVHFINSSNGFVGMDAKLQRIHGWNTLLPNLGRLLLPVGASYDLFDRKFYKVQVNGFWFSGHRTITLTIGGVY